MNKKDVALRTWLQNPARTAELINRLVLHSDIVNTEDLFPADSAELSLLDKPKEHRRDTKYYWMPGHNGIIRALFCFELQTEIDYGMVIRVNNYDYTDYNQQIKDLLAKEKQKFKEKQRKTIPRSISRNDTICPVITAVLSFDKKQWREKTHLKELFEKDLPKEVVNSVNDSKIRVISVHELSEQQLNLFQTDIKVVFGAIQRTGKGQGKALQEFLENSGTIEADAVAVINEFTSLKFKPNRDGGKTDMCEAVREMKRDFLAEGIKEGKKLGEKIGERRGEKIGATQKAKDVILNLLKAGYPEDAIRIAVPEVTDEMLAKYRRMALQ